MESTASCTSAASTPPRPSPACRSTGSPCWSPRTPSWPITSTTWRSRWKVRAGGGALPAVSPRCPRRSSSLSKWLPWLLAEWLYKCIVQRLVVVISSIESSEVLERWQFDIECDKTAKDDKWVPRSLLFCLPYPEYRCRHRINAMDLFLQTFLSALPSVCLQTSYCMIEHTNKNDSKGIPAIT